MGFTWPGEGQDFWTRPHTDGRINAEICNDYSDIFFDVIFI